MRTRVNSAAEHAARYEALRDQVLGARPVVVREGLAVMLRQGMAAWMEAWSILPNRPARVTKDIHATPAALPEGASVAVVHVLAAMALGHLEEVRL